MADIIDLDSHRELKIKVDLENEEGQRLLEAAIVSLWEKVGGFGLVNYTSEFHYHMIFMSFSDICFEHLKLGTIIVEDDGTVGVEVSFKEALTNGISELKNDLTANDNDTD